MSKQADQALATLNLWVTIFQTYFLLTVTTRSSVTASQEFPDGVKQYALVDNRYVVIVIGNQTLVGGQQDGGRGLLACSVVQRDYLQFGLSQPVKVVPYDHIQAGGIELGALNTEIMFFNKQNENKAEGQLLDQDAIEDQIKRVRLYTPILSC